MKKLVLTIIALMALSSISYAWEHPLNPDRFPSFGVALSGQGTSGDITYPSAPQVGSQHVEDSLGMFVVDTRLPLSNSFTLDLALGSVSSLEEADLTPVFNSVKVDSKGGYFRIGARYYFNRGARSSNSM